MRRSAPRWPLLASLSTEESSATESAVCSPPTSASRVPERTVDWQTAGVT